MREVLDAAGRLGKILIGMNKALGEIPVTVKLRTGVKDGRNTAHKLMPRLNAEWGAAALTVSIYVHSSLFISYCLIVATWTHATTALFEIGRLGLHKNLRCIGTCARRRGRS